ncbi:unnamed protein product, partial [Rotaria socialis]
MNVKSHVDGLGVGICNKVCSNCLRKAFIKALQQEKELDAKFQQQSTLTTTTPTSTVKQSSSTQPPP